MLPATIGNTGAAMLAIEIGAKGPNYGIVRTARRSEGGERPSLTPRT